MDEVDSALGAYPRAGGSAIPLENGSIMRRRTQDRRSDLGQVVIPSSKAQKAKRLIGIERELLPQKSWSPTGPVQR